VLCIFCNVSGGSRRGFLRISRRSVLFLIFLSGGCLALPAVAKQAEAWKFLNVGQPVPEGIGQHEEDSDGVLITSSGKGFAVKGDSFSWVYQDVKGGFDLTVLLDPVKGSGWAGLAFREGNETDDAGLFVGVRPDGSVGTWSQPEGEGEADFSPAGGPVWLRLQAKGSRVTALVSKDGSAWDELETKKFGGKGGKVGLLSAGVTAKFGGVTIRDLSKALDADASTPGQGESDAGQGTKGSDSSGKGARPAAGTPDASLKQGKPGPGQVVTTVEGGKVRIYLNSSRGDDLFDGKQSEREATSGKKGPKRTFKKALAEALASSATDIEIIIEGDGTPYEWSGLPETKKNLSLSFVGDVQLVDPNNTEQGNKK
jgi:hypothetical protein